MAVSISNFRKNIMGTASFDGKFDGMRKAQEFIVYPVRPGMFCSYTVKIQSDNRLGQVDLDSGEVIIELNRQPAVKAGKLSAEDLLLLKANVFASASAKAGSNGAIYCDNSGAADVFGVQS